MITRTDIFFQPGLNALENLELRCLVREATILYGTRERASQALGWSTAEIGKILDYSVQESLPGACVLSLSLNEIKAKSTRDVRRMVAHAIAGHLLPFGSGREIARFLGLRGEYQLRRLAV